MLQSFKGETDESDDRGLDEISDLLGLVSGTSRPTHTQLNRDYVTTSMMEGMRAQLEDTIQRQIKFQVEQELKRLDEKCDVILVKIPVLESRTDEITVLRRELEEERLNRGDDAQNFMKCINNLMEEIVKVGVKLSVAQEQIDEFEKRKPPSPATPPLLEPQLEPVPTTLSGTEQKQLECDKLNAKVTKLEGRVEAVEKWKESSVTNARLQPDHGRYSNPNPQQQPPRQCESDVVEMVFDLSKNLEAKFQEFGDSQTGKLMVLEERIGEMERKKESNSHQQRHQHHNHNQPGSSSSSGGGGGGSEAVGMVFDLSKDIQGQFKEFRESQAGKLQAVEKRLSKIEKKMPEQPESSGVVDFQKQIKSLGEQYKQAKTQLQQFEEGQTALKEKLGKLEKWKDSEQTRSDKNVKRMNDISKDMQAKFQEFGVSQAADIVALEERIGDMEKWKELDSERFQALQAEAAKTGNAQLQPFQDKLKALEQQHKCEMDVLEVMIGELQKWQKSVEPQGIKKLAEGMINDLSQTWKADLRQVQVIQAVYDVTLEKLKEDMDTVKGKSDKEEVVQMINELSKTVAESQRSQFNQIEKRIGRIEKWRAAERPQSDTSEVVELIGALTNDIKTKFGEIDESQGTFREMIAASKKEMEDKLEAISKSQETFHGLVADSQQEMENKLKAIHESQQAFQGIVSESRQEMASKFEAISTSHELFQGTVAESSLQLEKKLLGALTESQQAFQGMLATAASKEELDSKMEALSKSQETFQGIVTDSKQELEKKLEALEESQKSFQGILDASKLEMEGKFQAIIEESHDAFQGILADFKEEVQSSLIALEGNLEVIRGKVEDTEKLQAMERKLLVVLNESQDAFKVTLGKAKEEMEKKLLAELVQVNLKFMMYWERIEELKQKVKFPVVVQSSSSSSVPVPYVSPFQEVVEQEGEDDYRGDRETLAIQYEVERPTSSKETPVGKAMGKHAATPSCSSAAVDLDLDDYEGAASEQSQSSRDERGDSFPVRIIKLEKVADPGDPPEEEFPDQEPPENLNEASQCDTNPGEIIPIPTLEQRGKRANMQMEKETNERRSKRLRTSPRKFDPELPSTPSSRSGNQAGEDDAQSTISSSSKKTRQSASTASSTVGTQEEEDDDSPKTLCCNPLFADGEKSLPASHRGLRMLQRSLELSKRRSTRLSSSIPGSDHIVIKTEKVDGDDDASPRAKTRQSSSSIPIKIEPIMSPPKINRTGSPSSQPRSSRTASPADSDTPRRKLPRRLPTKGTPVQVEQIEVPTGTRTRKGSRRSSQGTTADTTPSRSTSRETTSKRGTRAHPILIAADNPEEEVIDIDVEDQDDDEEEENALQSMKSISTSILGISTSTSPPPQTKGKKHGKDPSNPLLCLCRQEFYSIRSISTHIRMARAGFVVASKMATHLRRKHKRKGAASRVTTSSKSKSTGVGVGNQDQASPAPGTAANKKAAGSPNQQKASRKGSPSVSPTPSSPTGATTLQPRKPAHGIGRKVFENGKKRYYCKCGRSFHHKLTQERHIQEHTAGKKFTCPLCPKEFLFNSVLKNHMREVHHKQGGGKGQFACSKCGEVFKNRKLCARHHRSGVHRTSSK